MTNEPRMLEIYYTSELGRNVITGTILTGTAKGDSVLIPRIPIIPNNLPFQFKRLQFPLKLAFAITINKSQGQTLKVAGINLGSPCFSHGQLYVACSRVSCAQNLHVLAENRSGPCRLVIMVAGILEIPYTLHKLDLAAEDHLKPEFLKLNPQHTIPTIVDDGFCLWESRAIARYLVNQYGEGNLAGLYPPDPKLRAVVDQRLDFDLGTLSPTFTQFFNPQIFTGAPPNPEQAKKLEDALKVLDKFLEEHEYAAGSELTIADLALVATVSTIDAAGIDLQPFRSIARWFEFVKEKIPGYDKYNKKDLDEFEKLVKDLKKARAKAVTDASQNRPPESTS